MLVKIGKYILVGFCVYRGFYLLCPHVKVPGDERHTKQWIERIACGSAVVVSVVVL